MRRVQQRGHQRRRPLGYRVRQRPRRRFAVAVAGAKPVGDEQHGLGRRASNVRRGAPRGEVEGGDERGGGRGAEDAEGLAGEGEEAVVGL